MRARRPSWSCRMGSRSHKRRGQACRRRTSSARTTRVSLAPPEIAPRPPRCPPRCPRRWRLCLTPSGRGPHTQNGRGRHTLRLPDPLYDIDLLAYVKCNIFCRYTL